LQQAGCSMGISCVDSVSHRGMWKRANTTILMGGGAYKYLPEELLCSSYECVTFTPEITSQ